MPEIAYLSLGSNLGDRRAQLDRAVDGLAEADGVSVQAVSAYHETQPVGGPLGQGMFLNAAARVETTREPRELLAALHAIEKWAGRVREVRWDARTLDLDLLLFGERVIDAPVLQVPHPRLAFRRFVLAPLAEVGAEAVHPILGRTVADLLSGLDRRPSYLALVGPPDARLQGALARRIIEGLRAVRVEDRFVGTADAPAALLERGIGPLRRDRWAAEDGWAFSEYWLDFLYLLIRRYVPESDRPDLRARFLAERLACLAPTLVVLVDPPSAAPAHASSPQGVEELLRSDDPPIARGVPILSLAADNEDAVVGEVLAACAACRPDLRIPPR